jgi:hypothetical protein
MMDRRQTAGVRRLAVEPHALGEILFAVHCVSSSMVRRIG